MAIINIVILSTKDIRFRRLKTVPALKWLSGIHSSDIRGLSSGVYVTLDTLWWRSESPRDVKRARQRIQTGDTSKINKQHDKAQEKAADSHNQ